MASSCPSLDTSAVTDYFDFVEESVDFVFVDCIFKVNVIIKYNSPEATSVLNGLHLSR